MQVPKEIINKWKILRSHGDNKRIIASTTDSVYPQQIARVFEIGSGPDRVVNALQKFYAQKEKNFPEIVSQSK